MKTIDSCTLSHAIGLASAGRDLRTTGEAAPGRGARRRHGAWVAALLVVIVLFSLASAAWALPVSEANARVVARNWMWEARGDAQAPKSPTRVDLAGLEAAGALYVFFFEPQGCVIVAADDVAHPVVFYTTDSPTPTDKVPPQLLALLESQRDGIRKCQAAPAGAALAPARTNAEWARLESPDFAPFTAEERVARGIATNAGPLLQTNWDQGQYYNASCPVDAAGPAGHVLVGCVATAMSQVMAYHRYPAQGTGSHSYTYAPYGLLSANFGATTYNWAAMPNTVSTYNPSVATLCYQVGVSVEMMYGPDESGAYAQDIPYALTTYFGYDTNGYFDRSSYSDSEWTALLRADLDAARPVIYAGQDLMYGGHCFVLDGYQNTDDFHVNWGWSGYYNGYFYLNSLNPDGYNFSAYQGAVLGVTPPGGQGDLIAHRAFVGDPDGNGNEITTAIHPGDSVGLYLEYSYTGTTDLPACTVSLSLDGVPSESDVPIQAGSDHYLLYATWTATDGPHQQTWTLDPHDAIAESDETNNVASENFTVGVPDDNYEPNNTLGTAYDLSAHPQTWLSTINGSGIQADDDWYKINVPAGSNEVTVKCLFTQADGDIDIALCDPSGTQLAVSNGTVDNESLDCVVPGTGAYYIRVYGANAGNTYDLRWNAVTPGSVPDLIAHRAFVGDPNGHGNEITSGIMTGDSVGLYVEYSYTGTTDLSCVVQLNLDGSASENTVNIPAGANHVLYYSTWTATYGSHTQTWALDPHDAVTETHENNNGASQTFSVLGTATIAFSPSTVVAVCDCGQTDNPSLQIWNSGSGPMNWTLTEDLTDLPSVAWFSASSHAGTSDGPNHHNGVTLNFNANLTPPGVTYHGNVLLTAAGATNTPVSVPVQFEVDTPVTAPLPGDAWPLKAKKTITWDTTAFLGKQVEITLWKGPYKSTSMWLTKKLKAKSKNIGHLAWKVPARGIAPGNDYWICVRSLTNNYTGWAGPVTIGTVSAPDPSPDTAVGSDADAK